MNRQAKQKLVDMLEPVVAGFGYELVGLEYQTGRKSGLLRVYIDSDAGISIDDCQQISHQVSGVLDVEDPISGHYTLEVSSPGLDRPLFTAAHYVRFIGREVKLKLQLPIDGRRNFHGLIAAVEDDNVILDCDGESKRFLIADIEKARLVPEMPGTDKQSN